MCRIGLLLVRLGWLEFDHIRDVAGLEHRPALLEPKCRPPAGYR